MACLQPSMSNELGGRPPTSEKAGQRLMPDRQFPLTIKRLGQLWILIRCSMPGGRPVGTRAGVINWGDVAPNSGLRAPKAAKPRGRMEAQRAGSTWTAWTVVSGPANRFSSGRIPMSGTEAQQRFRDLMLPHLDAAYTLARYLTRDEDVAQDLVQDAFVRALRGFGNYRGENARAWLLAIVRNLFLSSATARSSDRTVSLEAYVRPDCGEPDGSARELWDPDQDTPETALIRSSELEAPGTGSYPPLALSLGRLGQQVSVDPVQRSHQHGCPMMLSRLEWQPLAARHSYQVALRSLGFGMGLQVRPQGVAGLSPPEASRWQRTGCPRGSSPGTARPSCPPFSQSPAPS